MSSQEKSEIITLMNDVKAVNKRWNLKIIGTILAGILWLTFLVGSKYQVVKVEYVDWHEWRHRIDSNVVAINQYTDNNMPLMNFIKALKNKQAGDNQN